MSRSRLCRELHRWLLHRRAESVWPKRRFRWRWDWLCLCGPVTWDGALMLARFPKLTAGHWFSLCELEFVAAKRQSVIFVSVLCAFMAPDVQKPCSRGSRHSGITRADTLPRLMLTYRVVHLEVGFYICLKNSHSISQRGPVHPDLQS